MTTLDEIALTTSTDKSSAFHSYCGIYDDLFSPLRASPVRLLEAGILGGDSLRMWAQYFFHPATEIWGLDLHDRNFQDNDPRIHTVYGDAGSAKFLYDLPGMFDIAIDDASHFASHQINFFECIWPKITRGGILCIEDAHSVHSHVHRDAHMDILDLMNRVAHEMQDPMGATGSAKPNPQDQWHSIDSITLRKGLIIVRKRA